MEDEGPDLDWLIEHTERALQVEFGYTPVNAAKLVQDYYQKFQDASYCASIGIPVQNIEFFFHESPRGMAYRVHYYLGMRANPDPATFIAWRAKQQSREVVPRPKGR